MRRRLVLLSLCAVVLGSAAYAIQVAPWPPQPPRPADLVVSAYTVVSPPVIHSANQTVTITITETNLGPGPAPAYTTHHWAQGRPWCGRARPALAAGASATYTDSCPAFFAPPDCFPGPFTVTFRGQVDALNVVSETNEGNNFGPTVVHPGQCP